MVDAIDNLLGGIFRISGGEPGKMLKQGTDEKKEIQCIELYKNGWRQDGFERLPNSESIIVYWKKEGVSERISVHLTLRQQARWVRLVEKMIKSGELKI